MHHPFFIPFWNLKDDARATEQFIRLTPDRQSRGGSLWNGRRNDCDHWQMTIEFDIFGQGIYFGAVWSTFFFIWMAWRFFIRKILVKRGPFFGNTPEFEGLAVVVDTYDNDKSGLHPFIYFQVNGQDEIATHSDMDHENGCSARIRNQSEHTFLRITYHLAEKSLFFEYRQANEDEWTFCGANKDSIILPSDNFFGISAGTGDLADNHDIYNISTFCFDQDFQITDFDITSLQYLLSGQIGRLENKVDSLFVSRPQELFKEIHHEKGISRHDIVNLEARLQDLGSLETKIDQIDRNLRHLETTLQAMKQENTQVFRKLQEIISLSSPDIYSKRSPSPSSLGYGESGSVKASSKLFLHFFIFVLIVIIILFTVYLVHLKKNQSAKKLF